MKAWLADRNRPQIFRLFGYAGTGKTTLANHLAQFVVHPKKEKPNIMYAAFTGKAAMALQKKGCHGASTIHSLIYKMYLDNGKLKFRLHRESPLANADLLVVDEVSMVNEHIGKDLESFGVPILVIGDPAQLPPVHGAGYFTEHKPHVLLTEVHRQAADNPIIKLSMDVRQGRGLSPVGGAVELLTRDDMPLASIVSNALVVDQVLCGKNKTRHMLNVRVRQELNRASSDPEVGDRLICLHNDHQLGVMNGSLWEVAKVAFFDEWEDAFTLIIDSIDDPSRKGLEVKVKGDFFRVEKPSYRWQEMRGTQQFTYGYAITVHKSQGSQWPHVLLIDESEVFRDDAARHLYTGLTRASERLTVIV